jgi:hypothetical protein
VSESKSEKEENCRIPKWIPLSLLQKCNVDCCVETSRRNSGTNFGFSRKIQFLYHYLHERNHVGQKLALTCGRECGACFG